jgi:hypothetical protein
VTVVEEKAFPVDKATSKYSPDEVNEGAMAGSDPYCATVSAPTPVALAVVPTFVAVAVPVEPPDVAFAELVAPEGAAGGVGNGGGGVPGAIMATLGELVIAAPPMVPVMVAVPAVVGEVRVAV